MTTAIQSRTDLYQQVTNTIITQLEAGTVPWHKPWTGGSPVSFDLPENFITGKSYRGINVLLLWSAAISKEFSSPEWGSFKQWNTKSETIRKGEKGTMIVYYDTFEVEKDDEIKKIPFLKASVVFNRCQLSSFNPEEQIPQEPQEQLVTRLAMVEKFVTNTKAIIQHEGNRACYQTGIDRILMPDTSAFIDTPTSTATENYYSTLAHELTHWTGHSSRLDRKIKNKFGSELYAHEELVAELGAAFLCASLQITNEPRPDHASYIASWLTALKEDSHTIIQAASAASKAVDYLTALQPTKPM